MITVAGQIFIEYEKELENSIQIIKGFEDNVSEDNIKNVILDKLCGDNVKDICSEKDVIYKKISINRFNKIMKNIKRELLSNK